MVKIDDYGIELDRANAVYFPGEEVSGNLFIKVKGEPQKINGIEIEFKGEACVYWKQSKATYSWQDIIFEIKQPILEKQPNSSDLYLEPIENDFRFRFILPKSNLPTSYEHFEAHIRYWVKATIDIPWSINRYAIRCFTVINPLDLNRQPSLRQPYGVSDTKIVCCGPCKSDPITIDLNTKKTGFVPGEVIIFNVSIDNRSSQTIESMWALLVQHTEFICPTGSSKPAKRTHSYNILRLPYTRPDIGPKTQESWSNCRIKIPPVCPSLQDTCSIIKLEYKLTLVVNVKEYSMKKLVSVTIVIGTIPFTDSNLPSPNLNIRYFKSVLNRRGNCEHNTLKKKRMRRIY